MLMSIDLTLLISCAAPRLKEFMSCSEYHKSDLYLQDRFSMIFMSARSANETLGDGEFRCWESMMSSIIDVEMRVGYKVLRDELEEECEYEF